MTHASDSKPSRRGGVTNYKYYQGEIYYMYIMPSFTEKRKYKDIFSKTQVEKLYSPLKLQSKLS